MNLDKYPYIGTSMEIQAAYSWGKEIILWSDKYLDHYFIGHIVSHKMEFNNGKHFSIDDDNDEFCPRCGKKGRRVPKSKINRIIQERKWESKQEEKAIRKNVSDDSEVA